MISLCRSLWACRKINPINFANQLTGSTSAPQTVTLNNPSSITLNITAIGIAGTNTADFTQTNTCGSSLASSGICTISVTFAPTATGIRNGSITITDNVGDSPQSVSRSGIGTPVAPTVTISAPSVGYLANGSVTVTVTSSAGTVTGSVSLSVDGRSSVTQALSAGSTTFALTGLTAGDQSLSASYAAQGKFAASSATSTLQVNQATPTITWSTPAAITYGGALTATQLNATAPVPGTFVYAPAVGTVLGAGSQLLSVTFAPTDSTAASA